jgi:AraC-like DNA-binding protein/predicted N-acetyltransferase YhbS
MLSATEEIVMTGAPEMQKVVDHINDHLKDDITIVALADLASYSPWHFYRLFLNHTGIPVMEYVRMKRLENAVDELLKGRKLTDIALDYGFATQAGFCKAFRRHFGCSPSRYRQHKTRRPNDRIDQILSAVAKGGENMQERVIIRIMHEADADDLWENVFSANTPNEVKKRIAKCQKAYAEGMAIPLVAEVDGHVIATTYVKFEKNSLHEHIGTLFDVVVHPTFQRMGIARRLLEESKKLAAEKGKTMLCVSCIGGNDSETVYRKLGFIEYGRLPSGLVFPWGNYDTYDEVMFYMPVTDQ